MRSFDARFVFVAILTGLFDSGFAGILEKWRAQDRLRFSCAQQPTIEVGFRISQPAAIAKAELSGGET